MYEKATQNGNSCEQKDQVLPKFRKPAAGEPHSAL
jgi:hypothetical protein